MAFKMFIMEYRYFFIPFIAWWAAQILKFTITLISTKRIDFTRLTGSGGMPSSHASATVALAVALAIDFGLASAEFALAFALAIVVMYDAAGVRQSTGKQAKILNRLLYHQKGEVHLEDELKELIGHTPFEVIGGAALGFTVAFLLNI